MKYYVLYNAIAGQGKAEEIARSLEGRLDGEIVGTADMTKITNYAAFLSDKTDCALVICGGDGTLNRFVNDTADCALENEIFYCAGGSGNDFLRDIGGVAGEPICITEYLKDLPTVEVNDKSYRFINGVGYGIDGYCCEVGDNQRASSDKPVNYTSIAIKGLLFHYKPTNAKVTVDGKTYEFRKVWIAPTMNGLYYGGGMMPAPKQDRGNPEGKLSLTVFHDSGALKTLMIFPSIFKGEHVKKDKFVTVLEGNEITVEFDQPRSAQVDGETVLNVTSYTARSASLAKNIEEESSAVAE